MLIKNSNTYNTIQHLQHLQYNSNTYTTYTTNITLIFTLTKYLLISITLPIHALLYNTILKQRLDEILNYLQYDTNATKNDTNTAIQLLTN